MNYLSRDAAMSAIKNMKNFHDDIVLLYKQHGMDLLDNLGRRNIVMSQAQEKFFAQALVDLCGDVEADGKTGQPDIVIPSLGRELECKLTTRNKGGAISLQTDFETLSQKGKLDYLYVIADSTFNRFSVLHFIDLCVDDFRHVSNGSRGKVGMKKHEGMKKCNVLLGSAVCINDINISKWKDRLLSAKTDSRREKIKEKIEYWETTPGKYRFELEEVS
tara:strand:+ start:2219 stop:2872 length:654 start_codon:yes stop_codon:yes gene_type:complete